MSAALAAKICLDSCATCPLVGEGIPFCCSHWREIDHRLSPAKTKCWRITGAGLASGAGTQVPERCALAGLEPPLLGLALLPALAPPALAPPALGLALSPGALGLGLLTAGVLDPGPPVRG